MSRQAAGHVSLHRSHHLKENLHCCMPAFSSCINKRRNALLANRIDMLTYLQEPLYFIDITNPA